VDADVNGDGDHDGDHHNADDSDEDVAEAGAVDESLQSWKRP
jgi:hypothetical protein